jgi:hypothetical protein
MIRRGAGPWIAVVVVSLVLGAIGFWYMHRPADNGANAAAVGAVDIYPCPDDTTHGAVASIGQLHGGDRVWLVGVSQQRWGILRRPGQPTRTAWAPLSMLRTDATVGDLPEVRCNVDAATLVATTTTTTPPTTAPPTTVHTNPGKPGVPGTTTTSTTSTTTTTLVQGDRVPPTVTVTANRDHLFVETAVKPCSTEVDLEVTITVADSTLPVAIRSIVANWTTPAGPQSSGLTPIAGNRFLLHVKDNGPTTGEVPLVLSASAVDGAGNVGTGDLTVSLRAPASYGCGA